MPYQFTFDRGWKTTKPIRFLGRDLPVLVISEQDDELLTARQIAVIDSIDAIPPTVITGIDALARVYFQETSRLAGQDDPWVTSVDEAHITKHYRIDQVVIPRMRSCPVDYVFLSGECDWDLEHGIEILIKGGEPILCGPQDILYLSAAWEKYLA